MSVLIRFISVSLSLPLILCQSQQLPRFAQLAETTSQAVGMFGVDVPDCRQCPAHPRVGKRLGGDGEVGEQPQMWPEGTLKDDVCGSFRDWGRCAHEDAQCKDEMIRGCGEECLSYAAERAPHSGAPEYGAYPQTLGFDGGAKFLT